MQISLPVSDRNDLVTRAVQAVAGLMPETIEIAIDELEAQYVLQLANYVPLSAKRDAVASLINSSLPSEVQDQISDSSVIAVFGDLIRTGLVTLEVDWVEETPEPAPAPAPPPEPEPEE